MFGKMSIPYYDRIYSALEKDYQREAEYVLTVMRAKGKSNKRTLLDVACGTGRHLAFLKTHFACEGVDISKDFLKLARINNPDLSFHVGDMRSFTVGKKFDIITCFFSSIGFMTSQKDLLKAIGNMERHLAPGGLMLIEPWITPEKWIVGKVSMAVINEENLRIVRMSTAKARGNISYFELHYLVGTSDRTVHFVERHRAGLFAIQQMKASFVSCGLEVEYDNQGPTGRGLYLATKAL